MIICSRSDIVAYMLNMDICVRIKSTVLSVKIDSLVKIGLVILLEFFLDCYECAMSSNPCVRRYIVETHWLIFCIIPKVFWLARVRMCAHVLVCVCCVYARRLFAGHA